MRVLIFAPAFTRFRGGIEAMVALMTNYLSSKGFEVGILTTGDEKENPVPVFQIPESVPVFQLWLKDSRECRQILKKLILDFNPDVFIVRGASSIFFYMIDAIIDTNIRLILSESYDPKSSIRHFPSELSRLSAFAAADKIHLLMTSFSASLPSYMQSRIVPIPNPVEVNASKAIPEGFEGQTKYIINVSRIVFAQKAQDILLESFAHVAVQHQDWKLILVGDAFKEHDLNTLLENIDKFGLAGRVEIKGSLPKQEVFRLLANSHIFAFPSLFEGFGIALGEAMSSGLPCIGFADAPAVNELIQHNKNGLLVKPLGNAESFAKALNQLIESPELRKSMGHESIQLAENFEPDAVLKRWEQLIVEAGNFPVANLSRINSEENLHAGALLYRLQQENLLYDEILDGSRSHANGNDSLISLVDKLLPKKTTRRRIAAKAFRAISSLLGKKHRM